MQEALVNNDKPLCAQVMSGSLKLADPGLFAVGGAVLPLKNADTVEKEMLRVIAVNTKAVGSSLGLVIPTREAAPAQFVFSGKLPYYYVILGMALVALWVTHRIERTVDVDVIAFRTLDELDRWRSGQSQRGETIRVDIDFAFTNKTTFGADEPVRLDLNLKNVPTLVVKVFEINAAWPIRRRTTCGSTSIPTRNR